MEARPDALLRDLRSGDLDAFAHYYELYRGPVYNLAFRLLRDAPAAGAAVQAAFAAAYRQILLHDGSLDLSAWTYRAALVECRERLDERTAGASVEGATSGLAAQTGWREPSDLGRRFTQALETLDVRQHAALLLHDLQELRPAQMAVVFGVTEEAARALLFRARESFRRAFDELSAGRRGAPCRLAERAAAGAVGRGLSDDETRRLKEHAAYCRHCRRTMQPWGAAAIGLALFLEDAPLPELLETIPVSGVVRSPRDGRSAAASVAATGVLARIGRSLTGRAAAYALAAVCLAVSVGLVAQLSSAAYQLRHLAVHRLTRTYSGAARAAHHPPGDRPRRPRRPTAEAAETPATQRSVSGGGSPTSAAGPEVTSWRPLKQLRARPTGRPRGRPAPRHIGRPCHCGRPCWAKPCCGRPWRVSRRTAGCRQDARVCRARLAPCLGPTRPSAHRHVSAGRPRRLAPRLDPGRPRRLPPVSTRPPRRPAPCLDLGPPRRPPPCLIRRRPRRPSASHRQSPRREGPA